MHHWSRPLAPSELDRPATLPVVMAPGMHPLAVLDLARRLLVSLAVAIRCAWHATRAWEHELAARRGAGDIPARVRGLAAATATALVLSTLAGVLLSWGRDQDRMSSVAAALRAADSLGIDVARAPEVAGATASAGSEVAAAAPPTEAPPETPPAVPDPPAASLLPSGKGMWFHLLAQTGMTPDQIVEHAKATGLTHLYLRVGSSRKGFNGAPDLDRLLPAAHSAGLKVVGWDFPYLEDPVADAGRAVEAISYATPDGHRMDAFSADIETASEGVSLAADRVDQYGGALRAAVGPSYPLIGTVPNACRRAGTYPYVEVARHFDALAPMVYWINRDPGADLTCSFDTLAPLGRPILPVGQAYDPAIDNPSLVGLAPTYDPLTLFMRVAAERGATGVSFWAWHTASQDMWRAITDTPWSAGDLLPTLG